MSEISDMIQRLCPDGVEYRKLGEVCDVKRGERVTKAQVQKEGTFPVISGGVTPMGYLDKYNRSKNTITIAQYGSAGYVALQETDFWANDVCYSVFPTIDVDNKYLYYVLLNSGKKIDSMVNRDAVPYHLPQERLLSLLIPVPPLEVQRKIVEILDNFSELTAELTAELEARRKQYEYYRDNLLNFNQEGQNVSDVKWMKLEDVFDIITDYTAAGSFKTIADNVQYLKEPDYAMLVRTTDLKSHFEKGGFIYINKDAFNFLWRVHLDVECIVMPNVGNCGEVYYIKPELIPYDKCALAPNAILVKSKSQNNKYLSYILQTDSFQKQLKRITSPVGQSKFNKTELKKLLIPIPPLAEQERIVSILDRFEALTTDLTSGLPAEIKARQQQYEYYRDTLISFPRKSSNS